MHVLEIFYFQIKDLNLILARLISSEVISRLCLHPTDVLRLDETISYWHIFHFHTVELSRRVIYLARLI